jgi:hypothetical protein
MNTCPIARFTRLIGQDFENRSVAFATAGVLSKTATSTPPEMESG